MTYLHQQITYTVNETKKYLWNLYKFYNDKLIIKSTTRKLSPSECLKKHDFMIDGLDVEDSYTKNAFLKMTQETNVTLKICDDVFVHINFYHDNDPTLISKCIKRIYCMINVFGNQENIKKYNDAKFDILLYDAPRIMTNKYTLSSTEEMERIGNKFYFNCVCGYATIFNNKKFYICVTRKNGCLGLLTHELGHICELDLSTFQNGAYKFHDTRFKLWKYAVSKYFDVDKECAIGNMTEGINNGNSSILHAMFTTLEQPKMSRIELEKKYNDTYTDEFMYSIEMLGKLLHWFKYNSLHELIKRKKMAYTQTSMMLEYILIRCIYLLGYDELKLVKSGSEMHRDIDDNEYVLKFFDKMNEMKPIIDTVLKTTSNESGKYLEMEYYYNK